MTDVNTVYHGGAYPSGANAGIVEGGAYMIGNAKGCSLSTYLPSAVEAVAINWINANHQTLIAVSPYYYCDPNLTDWENMLLYISYDIQDNVSAAKFNRYWGGFLLDEEQNYWTSNKDTAYTAMNALNSYVTNLEWNQGDYDYIWAPYIEIGTASGWWNQTQYDNLAYGNGQTGAPQVYNSYMAGVQNTLVDNTGTWTLVTCDPAYPHASYPYNVSCSLTTQQIHGYPFQDSEWGSGIGITGFSRPSLKNFIRPQKLTPSVAVRCHQERPPACGR